MKSKLSKISRSIILAFLSFVNFIYAKTVHAMVIYAPPEVFERQEKTNILLDFIREYTALVIFVSLLAIIGLISIARMLLLKILKKGKKDQNIQLQKSTDELPKR